MLIDCWIVCSGQGGRKEQDRVGAKGKRSYLGQWRENQRDFQLCLYEGLLSDGELCMLLRLMLLPTEDFCGEDSLLLRKIFRWGADTLY